MKAFGKMHKEATKMEAAQFRETLDISMASKSSFQYYKELRSRYNAIIYQDKPNRLPPQPPSMHLDAAGPDAQLIMRSVFGSFKRTLGYG
jgi:hypothetical protein